MKRYAFALDGDPTEGELRFRRHKADPDCCVMRIDVFHEGRRLVFRTDVLLPLSAVTPDMGRALAHAFLQGYVRGG